MQRQAWFFLVAFVSANSLLGGQTASANNNQGSVADGKKELPQISANPRKAPQNAPHPGSNADDKKTSKPHTVPAEPEINIGGWDRGGELPKKAEEDPTAVTDEASDTKPATGKASSEKPTPDNKSSATPKSSADKPSSESAAKAATKGEAKANIKSSQKTQKGTEPKQAK